MRRRLTWILLCFALLGGVALLWRAGERKTSHENNLATSQGTASNGATPQAPAVTQPVAATSNVVATGSDFPYRLTNTRQNPDDLLRNEHAILLENALIDTGLSLMAIPEKLRA